MMDNLENQRIALKFRIKKLLLNPVLSSIRFIKKMHLSIHRFVISSSLNVSIRNSTRITTSTKIEARFGGSIKIGDKTELLDYVCIFSYGGDISIGNNCSINPYSIIYGHGGTTIGNNVLIAGHCMIIPNNHVFTDKTKLIWDQGNTSMGIIIGDDVWIGHGCSILDGVSIGKGAVIAAGSVVNRDIPEYTVYGGVPAKFISARR